MTRRTSIASALVPVALVTLFGSTALAADCKNVDIIVSNEGTIKIKALKIDYKWVQEGSKVRSESFNNSEVAANSTKTVAADQNLAAGEGYEMASVTLSYQVFCGGKWSVEKTFTDSKFDVATCKSASGKGYRVDLAASAVNCN